MLYIHGSVTIVEVCWCLLLLFHRLAIAAGPARGAVLKTPIMVPSAACQSAVVPVSNTNCFCFAIQMFY
jgi:hypothetical protein